MSPPSHQSIASGGARPASGGGQVAVSSLGLDCPGPEDQYDRSLFMSYFCILRSVAQRRARLLMRPLLMNFMHDWMNDTWALRMFHVIYDFKPEELGIGIDFSLHVVRVISSLKAMSQYRPCHALMAPCVLNGWHC